MKKVKFISVVVSLMAVLFFVNSAHALLEDNLDGTVTQTRNDGSMLMWLQDANYSRTSGYDTRGDLIYEDAFIWIDSLNNSTHLGYNDWRLPNILPINGISYDMNYSEDGSTDNGYNITSPNSELSYMWNVEFGGGVNTDPFINVDGAPYWSGNDRFNVHFGVGLQNNDGDNYIVWAVRDTTVVPEPISSILFITGGTLFAGRRFLRKRKQY